MIRRSWSDCAASGKETSGASFMYHKIQAYYASSCSELYSIWASLSSQTSCSSDCQTSLSFSQLIHSSWLHRSLALKQDAINCSRRLNALKILVGVLQTALTYC